MRRHGPVIAQCTDHRLTHIHRVREKGGTLFYFILLYFLPQLCQILTDPQVTSYQIMWTRGVRVDHLALSRISPRGRVWVSVSIVLELSRPF